MNMGKTAIIAAFLLAGTALGQSQGINGSPEFQAQQAALSNLDLARASYAEGYTGVLQVLDAERSYQQARLGYVRAVAQRYLDTVQLFLALGGTSPEADGYTGNRPDGNQEKRRPN